MMDIQTRILLTGFEPFGLLAENPSQIMAEALTSEEWHGAEVRCMILPVDFIAATERMTLFYGHDWTPDIVLHLGVARGRDAISLERFAINLMDSASGDNAGYSPDEAPIIVDAPMAYKTTIPCKRILQFLRGMGYEARLSNSAGTYVCNAVLFTSLHLLSASGCSTSLRTAKNVRCGFIHLPLFEKVDYITQFKIIKSIIQWLVKNQQPASPDYLSHGNAQ